MSTCDQMNCRIDVSRTRRTTAEVLSHSQAVNLQVSATEGNNAAPLRHTCREQQTLLPVIKRPEILQTLRNNMWRSLLDQPPLLQELANFCALCGQWFSEKNSRSQDALSEDA